MKTPLLSAVLFLCASSVAMAWGALGHETIGIFALQILQTENPAAYAKVTTILNGEKPADAATWMDNLKAAKRGTGPLKDDPEAAQFNADFPDNSQWHFDNLPLGSKSYTDDGKSSAKNDVVHEINIAITVLEGDSDEHTPVQALRMLMHFVGDIHQPLHVGTGYYSVAADGTTLTLVKTPAKAVGLPMDLGGNDIMLPSVPPMGPYKAELHSFWDDNLVTDSAKTSSATKYAAALAAKYATDEYKTTGSYHHWAEKWATESVKLADSAAYAGINPTTGTENAAKTSVTASVDLPAGYEASNTAVAETQIVRASYRLAALLGKIKYADAPATPSPTPTP
jgi:hypothetical protein